MNAPIRKLVQFSTDAVQLARQVGELARDVRQRTRYTTTVKEWGPSIVNLGVKFRVDVGGLKPAALTCVDVEDVTNRTKILPGAVQWQWVDGQAQIDDMWTPVSAGVVYKMRFLVVHDREAL